MEFTEFMFWKAVAIVVLVAVVNFFYALFTGKTLTEERTEAKGAPPRSPGD